MMTIVANPRQYKIPDWFLNRQKDIKDGRFSQITSSGLETKLRDDLERLKKIRWVAHRMVSVAQGPELVTRGPELVTRAVALPQGLGQQSARR
jgi:hypothetical protein